MDKAQQDALKKAAGIEAAKLIQNGMIAGLGTGSTVRFLVDELGPPTPTRSCGSWTSPRSWTPSASSRCQSR